MSLQHPHTGRHVPVRPKKDRSFCIDNRREYGDVATFVCRLLPAIRQLISIPAGLSRMRFARFSFFTGLGAGIWVTILTVLGYHFGNQSRDMSYEDLVHKGKETLAGNLLWIVLGCAVIVAVYVYVHRRVLHGSRPTSEPAEATPPGETPERRDDGTT